MTKKALQEALREATTGDFADRWYRAKEVLEKALADYRWTRGEYQKWKDNESD